MHYKDENKTLPQIARELNVDAVVEGSVLLSGQASKDFRPINTGCYGAAPVQTVIGVLPPTVYFQWLGKCQP